MEFSLIARIRQRAALREDVALGIGDDAALLRPAAGHELVATADKAFPFLGVNQQEGVGRVIAGSMHATSGIDSRIAAITRRAPIDP